MERFSEDIFGKLWTGREHELWFKARAFVLQHLAPIDAGGIGPDSGEHVHIVMDGASDSMLAVARQIALIAHFSNFDEGTGAHRTVITLCHCIETSAEALNARVSFGNLFDHCVYTIAGERHNDTCGKHDYLPLDVEFRFVSGASDSVAAEADERRVVITAQEVDDFFDNCSPDSALVDITKAIIVDSAYCVGADIDNLSASDFANVPRYQVALDVFSHNGRIAPKKAKWDNDAQPNADGSYSSISILNHLSSIFCADCFESRMRSIFQMGGKTVAEYLKETSAKDINRVLHDPRNLNALVYSEHARWNVEKLILGFAPLTRQDHYELECCFGQERKVLVNRLKKKHFRHIDLCSNKHLRRINPGNVKYDYFLMLAIPYILRLTNR